jgi:hypothetical protein
LVTVETQSSIEIYLKTINNLAPAIENEKPTKKLYLEKIGKNTLSAVDETKKRLVLVCVHDVRTTHCSKDIESDLLGQASVFLHIYPYDLEPWALISQGYTINITLWYQSTPSLCHLVFVTGTEELLLAEKSGLCRIFSLVTRDFRLEVNKSLEKPLADIYT